MKTINHAKRKAELYAAINSVQQAKEKYLKWKEDNENNELCWRGKEIPLGLSNSTQLVVGAPNEGDYMETAGFSTCDRQRIAEAFDEIICGVYDRKLCNLQDELKELMEMAL